MNEQLKGWAEESGFSYGEINGCVNCFTKLERFAEFVRQNEREICADLVFKMAQLPEFDTAWVVLHEAQSEIRARGNHEQY